MENSPSYSTEQLVNDISGHKLFTNNVLKDQIGELFSAPLKITKHHLGSQSISLYCSLPCVLKGTTIYVYMIIQFFSNYPDRAPLIYIYPYGELVVRTNLSYIRQNDPYYFISIPYLEEWKNTNSLKELVLQLYQLFNQEPPLTTSIPLINFKDIQLEKHLGYGLDGSVFKCKYKGNTYALKMYDISVLNEDMNFERANKEEEKVSEELCMSRTSSTRSLLVEKHIASKMTRLRREISIHYHLNNPNIVRIYGLCECEENHCTCLLLEKCKYTLHYVLTNKERIITINQVRSWIMSIIDAITYMHDMGIIHRDIKAENVLIDNSNQAKLCDFGFARAYNPNITASIIGTPTHVAPEVLNGEKYNKLVDVYSFGILLIEIFTRKRMEDYLPSFESEEALYEDLCKYMDKQILKIVLLCKQYDPKNRRSMKKIQSYFEKLDWSQIKYYA